MSTHYEVLGIEPDANLDEIKKAYRSLSFKHHPDRSNDPNSSDIMHKLNDAYEVLKDAESRRKYDASLQGIPNIQPFVDMHFGGMGMNIFDVLFSQMTGAGHHAGGVNIEIIHNGNGTTFIRRHRGKPETINKNVEITLEQAYAGVTMSVEIDRWNMNQQNGIQINEIISTQINIPAGVDNGHTILLENIGNSIDETNRGDVKIIISVKSHKCFVRQGADICFKKSVSLKEALCGAQFQFEYLNGKLFTLNVSNTIIFPGGKKAFNNMGMPKSDGTHGSLIIEFEVIFPSSLTQEQKNQLANIL